MSRGTTASLLFVTLLAWNAGSARAGDLPEQAGDPAANPPGAGAKKSACLEEPKHWSAKPPAAPGMNILLTRLIRFETPDGRQIPARVFLVELDPKQKQFPPEAPKTVIERFQAERVQLLCFGWEILVDEDFEPDIEVPAKFVRPMQPCTYEVELGAVRTLVQTTDVP